jgi:[ribosomal protein S5]-alanine N-acetyltransferase
MIAALPKPEIPTPEIPTLRTKRLILRAFTDADAPAYLALVSDPKVLRYTDEAPVQTLVQAQEILRTRPLRDYVVHGFGRMACMLQGSDELIGFCGLKRLPELHNEIDIGYRFIARYWGMGFASESAAAIYAHGKHQLKLERIIGLVIPENTASVRVLAKLGMRHEKVIRFPGASCDFDVYV